MRSLFMFLKVNWLYFMGAVLGGLGGYIHWSKVGCLTGSCPLKATPDFIVVWGAILGIFIVALIKRR